MLDRRQRRLKAIAEQGYAGVSYADTWNLNCVLAPIIANHLRAFLQSTKVYACHPDTMSYEKWLDALRKMIWAFEEWEHNDRMRCYYGVDFDDEDNAYMDSNDELNEWRRTHTMTNEEWDERCRRIREGMQLFIDYFGHLWI